ncbi:13804_t:CDS:2 [Acaulospora morrowiae]|uniref:13804_t:CDS:1 n=1 Tax=Acaulospora morrowiae TaxID=94023 RepID=A0A9N8VI26_9GLOM|nr:13804_t:CDS:2 [Acaulospora morrowiae]
MGTTEDLIRFDILPTQPLSVMPEICLYHERELEVLEIRLAALLMCIIWEQGYRHLSQQKDLSFGNTILLSYLIES